MSGLFLVYGTPEGILLSQHILVFGAILWLIDILKGVAWQILQHKLSCKNPSGYEALTQELLDPLPEELVVS